MAYSKERKHRSVLVYLEPGPHKEVIKIQGGMTAKMIAKQFPRGMKIRFVNNKTGRLEEKTILIAIPNIKY